MRKIPTLFQRDDSLPGRPVKPVVTPGCEWVLAGEGVPMRKIDGANCCIQNGVLMKRQKPSSGEYDEASYVACDKENPADKYFVEALANFIDANNLDADAVPDGIYEAIGPKIQGNPEKCKYSMLVMVLPCSDGLMLPCDPAQLMPGVVLPPVPRDFDGLREYLKNRDIEGIVFHRNPGDPDTDLAKLKGRDFGFKRPQAR